MQYYGCAGHTNPIIHAVHLTTNFSKNPTASQYVSGASVLFSFKL
jgi:hypothetical protein